jgi:protein O-mannosyl-transferase
MNKENNMGKAKKTKRLQKSLQEKQNTASQKTKRSLIQLASFIIIGLLVYWKIFSNNFVWDDQWQIIDAKSSLVIANIPQFFTHGITFTYRPLFFSLLALINSLFGLQPFFFHSLNIILHILNTSLLFLLLQRFFSKKSAFIASLLFLVHPMNVEPVANISFMMEPLYVFFGFSSLLIFLTTTTIHLKQLLIGCFFLFLSLLSKESGFIFIPIILSYFALFQKKDVIKVMGALFTIFCLYLLLRLVIAGSPLLTSYNIIPYEPIQRQTLPERLLNIPAIFSYYVSTFFFPVTLSIQQYWVVKQISFFTFYIPLSFLLLFIGGAIACAKILYRKKKEIYPLYLFFLFWFSFSIAFHFQLLPLTMTVADRWFYLPMAGFLGILLCLLSIIPPQIKKCVSIDLFMTIIGIIIILLALRSLMRTYDWENNYRLYNHDLQISQENYSLQNDLGAELLKRNKDQEAKKHLDHSIMLAPDWWLNWTNLATYYKEQKKYPQAEQAYKKAIINGKYINAYIYYAKMLLYTSAPGSTESARKVAQEGLTEHPQTVALWEILALSNYQLGKKEEAANAAKHAYLLTKNKNYQALYTAITQGVEFNIKQ